MLTLFQSHRASANRHRRNRGRHHVNEDSALDQAEHEVRALIVPHEHQHEVAVIAAEASARPLSRHRRQRYRSRNCQNFRRFGDFFQFVAQSDDAPNDDGGGSLRLRGRRSLRGNDWFQTGELQDLHSRVVELEHQRDLLQSSMMNSYLNAIGHAVDMVKHFYVLFANGYDPVRFPEHSHATEAFMRAVMDEDVVCTEFKGVDLFLNQYQVSSQAHASLKLALLDITAITDDDGENGNVIQIKASATCTLRIKRATLEQLFPAIIADEALTQQLIGKEYVLQYDKVFHFQRGVVFQHESRVDFGNGILTMVGDPFAATKLLEASLMTKHGHLRLDHRIEEDSHTLENTVLL